VPIPIDDVRLVVPYEITQRVVRRDGLNEVEHFVKVYKDVIVDRVVMERHTTGIDPFTGTDFADAEIPKEHQYDPLTGLPIFHRYIAGTRQRIEWPGEKEQEIEDIGVAEEGTEEKKGWVKRLGKNIKNKIWPDKPKSGVVEASMTLEDISTELNKIEAEMKDRFKTDRPKSHDPRFADAIDNVDTTRNIVEDPTPIQYRLINSPFPEDFGEELRAHRQEFVAQSRKNNDDAAPAPKRIKRRTEQGQIASELAKAKIAAAQSMKTPMQLRWETEHAKKVKQQKKAPLVSADDLMAALDNHLKQKKAQKAPPKTAELD
jgi:large subunit ribosomal protein L24